MVYYEAMNLAVADALRERWEENYIANRARIKECPPFMMARSLKNRAALCVGAGPSLKKNIDDIDHKLYDIICCDKMAGKLYDMGQKLKFVVALNAEATNVQQWLEPIDDPSVTLVVPCGVHPEAYENWCGKLIFINAVTPTGLDKRVHAETGHYPMLVGSNAGTFAFLLATYLGYDPIAYVGLDFSFLTKEEVERNVKVSGEPYNIVELTDSNGDVRYTTLGWVYMVDSFQEHCKRLNMNERTIVSAVEGGINNSDYVHMMTLRDFNKEVGPFAP